MSGIVVGAVGSGNISLGSSSGGSSTFPSRVPIVSTGAGDVVATRFDQVSKWAENLVNRTEDILKDLRTELKPLYGSGVNLEQINTQRPINVENLPDRSPRQLEEWELRFGADEFIRLDPITEVNVDELREAIGQIPEDIGNAPSLNFSPKPIVTDPPKPQDRPALLAVEDYIPEDLTVEFPPLPDFIELNLPKDAPEIIDVLFDGVVPEHGVVIPEQSEVSKLTAPEYQSQLFDEIKAELRRKMQGGTGLPPAIEAAIYSRAREREDANADRAILDAVNDWASRGFTLPSGILDAKMQAVREANQAQANTFSRETEVNAFTREQQNLEFAVVQGIAFENISVQIFSAIANLLLAQAQAADEFVLNALRAKIEVYNAEVSMFRVQAEVYRERVRAQLSKVEIYRAQIEAERVKGELNQQKVALYREELQAVSTMVEVYVARLGVANSIAEVNRSTLQAYETDVNAYRAFIDANRAEYEAWGTEIEAEMSKMRGYEVEAQAFSSRVNAYRAKTEATATIPQLKLEEFRAKNEAYRTDIQRYAEHLRAETERVGASIRRYEAEVNTWSVDSEWLRTRVQTQLEEEKIKLEDRRIYGDFILRNNDLRVQEYLGANQMLVNATEAGGAITGQLAAAAVSAVNASASISESASASNSWSFSDSPDNTSVI